MPKQKKRRAPNLYALLKVDATASSAQIRKAYHALARKVADWWPRWTLGLFSYRIDRTHSIMRIATTASPVSGAELRERMKYMALKKEYASSMDLMESFAKGWRWTRDLEKELRARGVSDPKTPDRRPPRSGWTAPARVETVALDFDEVDHESSGKSLHEHGPASPS